MYDDDHLVCTWLIAEARYWARFFADYFDEMRALVFYEYNKLDRVDLVELPWQKA